MSYHFRLALCLDDEPFASCLNSAISEKADKRVRLVFVSGGKSKCFHIHCSFVVSYSKGVPHFLYLVVSSVCPLPAITLDGLLHPIRQAFKLATETRVELPHPCKQNGYPSARNRIVNIDDTFLRKLESFRPIFVSSVNDIRKDYISSTPDYIFNDVDSLVEVKGKVFRVGHRAISFNFLSYIYTAVEPFSYTKITLFFTIKQIFFRGSLVRPLHY